MPKRGRKTKHFEKKKNLKNAMLHEKKMTIGCIFSDEPKDLK